LFQLPDELLGHTDVTAYKIITTDDRRAIQYRFSSFHKDEINKQVKDLMMNNVNKSSNSLNSPVWVVPKKSDTQSNKKWRMVRDFRVLNEKTTEDACPLPNIRYWRY